MLQRTDEWFKDRCGCATASRFADVLATIKNGEAASRRNYRAQLVVERMTGVPQESYQNEAMRFGIEHEPFARIAYEAKTGNIVTEVGFVRHQTLMAGCSPDGIIGDDGGIEIKCPYQSAVHINTLLDGAMPSEHMPQIQGSLWITGRKYWVFVSYDPRMPPELRLFTQRIDRDEIYIKKLEKEIERFLEEVDNTLERIHALVTGKKRRLHDGCTT